MSKDYIAGAKREEFIVLAKKWSANGASLSVSEKWQVKQIAQWFTAMYGPRKLDVCLSKCKDAIKLLKETKLELLWRPGGDGYCQELRTFFLDALRDFLSWVPRTNSFVRVVSRG